MKIARLSLPLVLTLAGCIQLINPVANVTATGTALVDTSIAVSTDAGSSQAASPDVAATNAPTAVPTSTSTPAPVPTPTPQVIVVMVTPTPAPTPMPTATPTPAPVPTPTPTPVPQASMIPIDVTMNTAPRITGGIVGPFLYGPFLVGSGARTVKWNWPYPVSNYWANPNVQPYPYLIPETADVLTSVRKLESSGDLALYRNGVAVSRIYYETGTIDLRANRAFVAPETQNYYFYSENKGTEPFTLSIQ